MHSSPRIVFCGTPQFASIILDRLTQSRYRPILVITEPDKPAGRKQILTPPAVKTYALTNDLPVAQPANQTELFATLQAAQPDLIIVAAYGRILKQNVIDLPQFGILNVHASLLPKYRGASPIQTALLNGETHTGVTIMKIDAGLDTGPILSSRAVAITDDDTTLTLSQKLAEIGADLLIETLPSYLDGTRVGTPQNNQQASLTRLINKENGRLTGKESPTKIMRLMRAYTPWPGVWAEIDGTRILLRAAHIEKGRIAPDIVQLAGKNPVAWDVLTRDYPKLTEIFRRLIDTQSEN